MLEVCLADDKGEELDLIVREEIKQGASARERKETKDQAVQAGGGGELDDVLKLMREFPNLQTGGGLLPDPPMAKISGERLEPLEWMVVVYPRNQRGGRRVIHPSPSFN